MDWLYSLLKSIIFQLLTIIKGQQYFPKDRRAPKTEFCNLHFFKFKITQIVKTSKTKMSLAYISLDGQEFFIANLRVHTFGQIYKPWSLPYIYSQCFPELHLSLHLSSQLLTVPAFSLARQPEP